MPLELRVHLDVPFTTVPTASGERTLVADLWIPQTGKPVPLVVYLHGGGWRGGNQYHPPCQPRLFDRGIGVAAMTYRFSQEKPFPAMLHDCKTGVRWLRANAGRYGLDPERFAAWGISAGAHLASLMALTQQKPEFEGDGPFAEQSSAVRAVVSWCGPTNMVGIFEGRPPVEGMMGLVRDVIGGPFEEKRAVAEAASPVRHVGPGSVPHLIVHGRNDPVVLPYHATDLHEALQAAGAEVELLLVDTGHNVECEPAAAATERFITKHLLG